MNNSFILEAIFWVVMWIVETLIIKLLLGVPSWWMAILLAITVGSFVVMVMKHLPDILE